MGHRLRTRHPIVSRLERRERRCLLCCILYRIEGVGMHIKDQKRVDGGSKGRDETAMSYERSVVRTRSVRTWMPLAAKVVC